MNETNVSTTKKELGKADGNLTVKVLKHSVNLIKIKNSAK